MHFEFARLSERFPAYLASIGLLSSVCSHVNLKLIGAWINFGTNITLLVFHTLVNKSQVFSKFIISAKALAAHLTFLWPRI